MTADGSEAAVPAVSARGRSAVLWRDSRHRRDPASACTMQDPSPSLIVAKRLFCGERCSRCYGLASKTMLNGPSVARRTLLKPASVRMAVSLASPACAPSASPTSCASDVGTQIIVEAL